MRRKLWTSMIGAAAVAVVCSAADGAGRFNMPTSLSQCFGYGYGAGYHAPLMLAPPWVGGIGPERIRRVPASRVPANRAGAFAAPSSYVAPAAGYHFGPEVYPPMQPTTPGPNYAY